MGMEFMRLFRWLMRTFACLGFWLIAVTILPIDRLWLNAVSGPWNDPTGDILVVLGADSIPDMIGLSSYWRSVYAARVWKDGGFSQIMVSGGRTATGAMIGEQMREFLIFRGVPASAVLLEAQSSSTRENALYTARLLSGTPGRKVLLTSDYHMFRAYRAFRKAGLEIEPRPFPDAAKRIEGWMYRWDVFLELSTEAAKSIYYYGRGWI